MSHGYQAVGWNRQKKIYLRSLLIVVALYLVAFFGFSLALHQNADPMVIAMRAFGTCALILLHLILCIGPLCRLDRRWLPWLYNRRHMGVTMFLLALVHGVLALVYYHSAGDTNPLVSLFISNTRFDSLAHFPFQPLGFFALVILFLMAATSHDFWLAQLTPPMWKTLHMAVYFAYALLIGHVALGYLQTETGPVPAVLLGFGLMLVSGLHVISGALGLEVDRDIKVGADEAGYKDVLSVAEIPEKCGRIITMTGDRVAVFKYDGKISAISNACQHQNGPLGEGKVIDGLVTCPWHGFQYDPASGASPPPFTEKVPTFNVKVIDGRIWVHPKPNLPGTHVEPARIEEATG